MTVSFYSYKGGVGRTTMVANTGWALAHAGLRVLLIDCDLEAPGLLQYFTQDSGSKDGLLDLLEHVVEQKFLPEREFRKFARSWAVPRQGIGDVHPDIKPYINDVAIPRAPLHSVDFSGVLHVITPANSAGTQEYARRLQDFSAREFDDRYDARNLFKWLKKRLSRHYDVVLVDSRTGFSEVGRLVADALADAFVFVMAPNMVNLKGTNEAIRYFRGVRNDRTVWVVPSRLPTDLYGVMSQGLPVQSLSIKKQHWLKGFQTLMMDLHQDQAEILVPHSNAEGGMESLVTRSFVEALQGTNPGIDQRLDSESPDGLETRRLGRSDFQSAEPYFRLALIILGAAESMDAGRSGAARALLESYMETEGNTGIETTSQVETSRADGISETPSNTSVRDTSNRRESSEGAPPKSSPTPADVPAIPLATPPPITKVVYLFSAAMAAEAMPESAGTRIIALDDSEMETAADCGIQVFVVPSAAVMMDLDEKYRALALNRFAEILSFGTRPGSPVQARFMVAIADLSGYELLIHKAAACLGRGWLDVQGMFQAVRVLPDEAGAAEFLASTDLPAVVHSIGAILPTAARLNEDFHLLIPPPDAPPTYFEDVVRRLDQLIGYKESSGSARKWWDTFKAENQLRLRAVAELQREIFRRKATITEFFLAYVYSNTDNIQANLHYLDYTRLKKEEEKRKREKIAKTEDIEVEELTGSSKELAAKSPSDAPAAHP
jgi:cellulose biosynthesis protein BcsQ